RVAEHAQEQSRGSGKLIVGAAPRLEQKESQRIMTIIRHAGRGIEHVVVSQVLNDGGYLRPATGKLTPPLLGKGPHAGIEALRNSRVEKAFADKVVGKVEAVEQAGINRPAF